MEIRYSPNPESVRRLTTEELRKAFVIEELFIPGKITMLYSDADRVIIGGCVPTNAPLQLLATKKEMSAEYFCERREVGIINIGSKGSISVDGKIFTMETKDLLYISRGSKEVLMNSAQIEKPAQFYLISYPAHKEYPTRLAKFANAEQQPLGNQNEANVRTIYKYIHLNGIQSCQLVMGLTELAEGSVWNSMPPHTHNRRSEIYMYFNMQPNSVVFHFMGEPTQSRNLLVHNGQAVISPSWSIHCGAGTGKYSFVWAMGGENQEFSDMDVVEKTMLR
ncbi:MAG: 5-dehydro-4-deoxy-D-glucuronate isomerase [Bacteroidota bacterium]|nr:5-dehydro-4-deoxy-D-glucuronate isomerase [Bacteroidota bacterium]